MSSGLTKQDMKTIIQVLEEYSEVETAVLYGSRALGTYQRGSDIDIALKGRKLTSSICSHIHFKLEEETLLPYLILPIIRALRMKSSRSILTGLGKSFMELTMVDGRNTI